MLLCGSGARQVAPRASETKVKNVPRDGFFIHRVSECLGRPPRGRQDACGPPRPPQIPPQDPPKRPPGPPQEAPAQPGSPPLCRVISGPGSIIPSRTLQDPSGTPPGPLRDPPGTPPGTPSGPPRDPFGTPSGPFRDATGTYPGPFQDPSGSSRDLPEPGLVCFVLVGSGLVWFRMVWFGLVLFGPVGSCRAWSELVLPAPV